MHIELSAVSKASPAAREVADIVRKCVHCGFCNAVCPTYRLMQNELDGPRGRLYLIKSMLEGHPVTSLTRQHLDRCLNCLACERLCPSGVRVGEAVDLARLCLEPLLPRRGSDAWMRRLLKAIVPHRHRFGPLARLGQWMRPLLPSALADKLPTQPRMAARKEWSATRPSRRMLIMAGCVQPSLAPETNQATVRVLRQLGVEVFEAEKAGCCGALRHHLADPAGLDDMRRNVDAWYPHLEDGVEAIVVTASGCGVQVRDYGHLLRHDPAYAEKAARVSAACRDPVEVLLAEAARLMPLLAARRRPRGRIAFHAPCSLQHGLQLGGRVEPLLEAAGFVLVPVADAGQCCGSAGSYSLLQPSLAMPLRDARLSALSAGNPDLLATANIGCQMHLQAGSTYAVVHWITLIDDVLDEVELP